LKRIVECLLRRRELFELFENGVGYPTMRIPRSAVWMGAAFASAAAIAIVILILKGVGESGIRSTLRVTARWSYLWFWLAYAGGALAVLLGSTFRRLAQCGRELGLAFASAHLVHVGLVLWLYHIIQRPPLAGSLLIFFGVGIVWTYLLALLSIPLISGMMAPTVWRIVRTVGVEYIAIVFFYDFARSPIHGIRGIVFYAPFLGLAVAGPLLRLAMVVRRLDHTRKQLV
jgi:hypothetical protein